MDTYHKKNELQNEPKNWRRIKYKRYFLDLRSFATIKLQS